ncbi:MAG: FkbM family methyltransferase [Peptococcaceae bacterium]
MLKRVYELLLEEKAVKDNDDMSVLRAKDIFLFGAGGIGYITGRILTDKGYKVCCFIDDDQAKQGTELNGIKILGLQDVDCTPESVILICTPNPMNIRHKLLGLGYENVAYLPVMMLENSFYDTSLIAKESRKLAQVYDLLADEFSKLVFSNILQHRITMDFSYFTGIVSQKQYFPTDIFTLNDQECFVDGGAYNGETIRDFIKATGNSFTFIYGFEPDKQNFDSLEKELEHIGANRLKLFNAGLYSATQEACFDSHGNSSSHLSESGKDKISLVKFDDIAEKYKPTYIKLDIEGAEREALEGMENTLKAYRPKLAVSVYHKADDLWELPLVVHSLNSSYKIYLRHYMGSLHETVCYAV